MHVHEPSRAPPGGSERRTPAERDPLLDGVTDGILVVDGQWRLTWLNAALERLLGRPREGLLGRVLWEALGDLNDSGFAPAWRRAMDARTLVVLEDFLAPVGVWLESRAFPSGDGLAVFVRDVSERRLVENERVRLLSAESTARLSVESERARFQEMLMLAPTAVSITRGPEHRFVFSNLLHRRFHGNHDLAGQPMREALPELGGQGIFEMMDRVFASGTTYVGRARPMKASRVPGQPPEEMFFDIAYHPQRDGAGRVEGVAVFAYDVTDLVRSRRTAEALARDLGHSEERFRSLVTATMDITWVTPPSGEFAEDQPGWRAFTGQTREELRGWGWLDAVHPEEREAAARIWRESLASRSTPYLHEYRLRRQDGAYRHMMVRAVPVREPDGSVREWVGAHRDVTMQRQGEAALERLLAREQRHAAQLQGLASAALVISEADSIGHMLKAITEQAREVVGAHQALTCLVEGEWARSSTAVSMSDRYSSWRDWDARLDGTGIYAWVCRLNLPLRLTQEELAVHPASRGESRESYHPPLRGWLGAPLVGRDGRNLGFIQLSDRHEGDFSAEDEAILVQLARMASVAIENTRLMAEAQAANRAKDEFLAVMSHELRTPLTAVLGWTQILRGRQGDARAVDKGLGVIERNARALAQLIEDVLDVSRIITGKLTLHRKGVEWVGVVQAAVEVARSHADMKGVGLTLDVDVGAAGTAVLVGDPGRLQQVCWNLLVNAVKFTPAGGQVRVRVERSEHAVSLRVTDTGKGIRADFLPHLFERFWQADGSATREHGGLGLGLAIVHHLVGLHGGSVRAESAGEGRGSTFLVTLPVPPVLPEVRTEALPGVEVAPGVKLDGVSVLLVEDAPDARELIALMLRERGARVETASTAAEAMGRLQESLPDVLVSDIGLPGEDGHALLRRVRAWAEARDQWVPAIALTAYAGAEDARRAYRAGFQVHMAKPLEPAALIEAVARLAGRADVGAQAG